MQHFIKLSPGQEGFPYFFSGRKAPGVHLPQCQIMRAPALVQSGHGIARIPYRSTLVIIKNNTLDQIKWEQMVFQGNSEYQCDLFPIDFVALAKAVGANGVRIDDPRTAGAKLDEALAMPGPVIIEAVVDQFTAMLPAKINADQAMKFSQALAKGQPNRPKIALTAASDTVRQIA